MKGTMKFGCLVKKGQAEIREIPLPSVGEHQVLVKQLACNICTADYGQWTGVREHQGYPAACGHEAAGIIVEKGNKVQELEIGDLVAVGNNYCGECTPCREGRQSECKIRSSFDDHGGGYKGRMGFADYCVRNVTAVVKMNKELDPREAAFLEPVATVVKGIKKLRLTGIQTVVVIGGGTMGILNAQVAKAYGARVIVSEMMSNKLKVAKDLGFLTVNPEEADPVETVIKLTGGRGADAVVVAVGSTKANSQAQAMLKKMDGKLLVFAAAYPSPEIGVTANDIHYRRLEIIGTYLGDTCDFLDAAYLLNTRSVQVDKLIEHTYPLEQIQEAFVEASTPGKYRVSVWMHSD